MENRALYGELTLCSPKAVLGDLLDDSKCSTILPICFVMSNGKQPTEDGQQAGASVRNRKRLSKVSQIAIFRRDGWLCCWCKRPVIFGPAMKFLKAEVINGGLSRLAYYHAHWTRDGAPLLDELGAVIDHVEAFSIGGVDSEENLITACNKCNGRKSAAPLDKWSKRPVRKPIKGKYGEPQHWDGLASVFVALAERNRSALTIVERAWLRAIKSNGD